MRDRIPCGCGKRNKEMQADEPSVPPARCERLPAELAARLRTTLTGDSVFEKNGKR